MAPWNLKSLLITSTLFLINAAEAEIPFNCDYASEPTDIERCQKPLEDITIVTPGEFIVAKLQCYGCPTVERTGRGGHKLTHEENALVCILCSVLQPFTNCDTLQVFNISLSTSHKALLVNDIEVFPSLAVPPEPDFLTYQVPLNFSVSSLASTIDCAKRPCGKFGGRCACVENALGAYATSFDYAMFQAPEDNAWTIHLDTIGGHNGYMVDSYVEFGAPKQRVLAIYIQPDATLEALEIVGAALVEREHAPFHEKSTRWGKVLKFFGFESCKGKELGHIVYRVPDWDSHGRVGTLKHFLLELWGEWPWYLIFIIAGSVVGGLAIIYQIYKFAMEVRRIMIRNNRLARGGVPDDEDKEDEREGLLDEGESP
jgi:hypothetical protein